MHMCFFYTVLPLVQLILWGAGGKQQQLRFWLPVTGSLEERGNRIDDFRCLFQYYVSVLPPEPVCGAEQSFGSRHRY